LVIVTVCGALVVPTACGPKVSDVGENVKGCSVMPFISKTCGLTAPLVLKTIPPVTEPARPYDGKKSIATVQRAPAASVMPAVHGFPLPPSE